jgi:hypothetical protein
LVSRSTAFSTTAYVPRPRIPFEDPIMYWLTDRCPFASSTAYALRVSRNDRLPVEDDLRWCPPLRAGEPDRGESDTPGEEGGTRWLDEVGEL